MIAFAARRSIGLALSATLLLPASVAVAAPAGYTATDHFPVVRDPADGALRLLEQPPFPPTDVSLLTTQAYPQGPPMVPAPPRVINDQELIRELKNTLKPRGHRAVEEGLAAFSSRRIAAVMPDANLRAALASLAGSPAQGSMRAIRKGVFRRVLFGSTPNPAAIAQSLGAANGQSDIVFNQRFHYEDFRLLGVILSHETMHQDARLNANEELICTALHTAYYGQLLLLQPRLAASHTELSRRLNTGLMALLNTRDARGKQRLTHSTGNVLPGSATPLPGFGAAFLGVTPSGGTATDPTSTPGNANLDFYLGALTHTRQTRAAFNTTTVKLLDTHQTWATPSERVRLARLLKLDTLRPSERPVAALLPLTSGVQSLLHGLVGLL
ncbi:hypothetical protein [Streptomyces olivaceoviridis]|uniref:hypothetical protein n=1 Tax=Streptomyces olivaceoviridis TaxID=1921 RepID=UPI00370053B5